MVENLIDEKPKFWLDDVEIRNMKEEDLPLLEWEGKYAHYRRLYAEAYERYLLGRSVLWVAELSTVGLIGQVFIQLTCDRPELADGVSRAYLYAFRVRPAFRGYGIGSQMMLIAEEDLKQRGFRSVTLNVARTNRRARKLYERHHYKVVAYEPGQWAYQDEKGSWHSVNEPAWRMEKILP